MRTNGMVEVIVIEGSPLKGVKPKMRGQILKIGVQGGSNMTGTDLMCKHIKSVLVIFEPPCIVVRGIQAKSCVKSEVENEGYVHFCPKYVM